MKPVRTISPVLLSIALSLSGCFRAPDPKPVIKGQRFFTKYDDLVGSIRAIFTVNGWNHEKGGVMELSYSMDIEFNKVVKNFLKTQVKGMWIAFAGERSFDKNGRFRQMSNTLMSTQLTTTGIPIENGQPLIPSKRIGNFYGTPFDFVQYIGFHDGQGADGVSFTGSWIRTLDETVPEGLYRTSFDFYFDTQMNGIKQWSSLLILPKNDIAFFKMTSASLRYFFNFIKTFYPKHFMPMIKVGEVQTPRMPWILFPEVVVNGKTGVVAIEDQGSFGLSFRRKYPTRLILDPGRREFYPCFISEFPQAANVDDIAGAFATQYEIPLFLDYESGEVAVRITSPDGMVHDLGKKHFIGQRIGASKIIKSGGGPKLKGGDYSFDFNQWGRYEILMTGWINDRLGRRIEGGGTYELWVGRWLTYSSSVKPGTNFFVGGIFPSKLEINPPCPANIEVTVEYFPMSDPARKRVFVEKGRANRYGYYFPPESAKSLIFNEPGEYRAMFRTEFRSPDGTMWYGDQTSVGVIAPEESRIELHGMRALDLGELYESLENFGMTARYELNDENNLGLNIFDMSDCYDIMIPYYSGDILFFSANYTGFQNVTSYLSMEPKDPVLRKDIYDAFPSTPLLAMQTKMKEVRPEKMLRPNILQDLTFIMRNDDKADQFPIFFQNSLGYHPFSFPEYNTVEAYTYFTSLRPGFSAYVITSDSMLLNSYWTVSPNNFGHQFNAGVNGDMPNDIYRISAALVYKDKKLGTVDYAVYASTAVASYKDTNNNRVEAPCENPLFTLNGRQQWMALAMATTEVLEVGDRISLSSMIFPPVPADVEGSITWPDGRVEHIKGQANKIGVFGKGVFTVDIPGVYKVKEIACFKGKCGDVFGSGDGVFNHYVVEKNKPDFLDIDFPPVSDYDIKKIQEIPIAIRDGYSDPKITYSVFFPGIIADEGEFTPKNGKHIFRFIPSQMAMQFPNFDITDYSGGKPMLNDSVFLVFFAEANSPEGKKVYDVAKVMIRGQKIYYLNPKADMQKGG